METLLAPQLALDNKMLNMKRAHERSVLSPPQVNGRSCQVAKQCSSHAQSLRQREYKRTVTNSWLASGSGPTEQTGSFSGSLNARFWNTLSFRAPTVLSI